MLSAENVHTDKTTWTQKVMFENMYVNRNAYMQAIAIDVKRGPTLEGK